MKPSHLKYLFYTLSLLLLLIMGKGGMEASTSGDEQVHYNQSLAVYRYWATWGKDTTALNTPTSHLNAYGQSVDNLTTILEQWLHIEDVYLFRHLFNSVLGWITVMVTAFFALWLSGYLAAILVILLFALSPTFLGHATNNLKDIPFALSYIASLYGMIRWLLEQETKNRKTIILLLLSLAFSLSIRPGGLLLFAYLPLFAATVLVTDRIITGGWNLPRLKRLTRQGLLIVIPAYLLALLLWPWALISPFRHVWESYQTMAHFPTTLMQIFEGKAEWSDWMPWYYLPKSMVITIPLLVLTGILVFKALALKKIKDRPSILSYSLLGFAIFFPIVFVILSHANLYGSWRHMLFVYPVIVLIAAWGWSLLLQNRRFWVRSSAIGAMLLLALHPARFMVQNSRYAYCYYNPLVGGLSGAYGQYETDYYYHSLRENAEWLTRYLHNKAPQWQVRVASNFPADWYFRKEPNIQTFYTPYDQRSQSDWDYMLVINSYIPPWQLQHKRWPPANTIHTIEADGIPIAAVLKRETKNDLEGYRALQKGDTLRASKMLASSIKIDSQNELIFFNFASVLLQEGKVDSAQIVLHQALKINPGCEPVLFTLGKLATSQGRKEEAIDYYRQLIGSNRKYLEGYIPLALLLQESDLKQARRVLKQALTIDPWFTPAIKALANTYRTTDPEVARKYDELATQFDQIHK